MSNGRNLQQTAVGVLLTLVAVFAAVVAQNVSEVTSQSPVIVHGPKPHLMYNAGQVIELPCKSTGQPAPRYEWYKNNVFRPDLMNFIQTESGTLLLRTDTSAEKAEGYYQCRTVNGYGVAISNISFLQEAVLEGIHERVARNVTVLAGQSITLPCNHTRRSVPSAHHSWYTSPCVRGCHEKNRVRLTERITMDEKGSLVIGHVEERDGMDGRIYKCESENPYRRGSHFGSYTRLIVKPNPHENRTTVPNLMFATQSPVTAVVGDTVDLDCFYYGWLVPNVSWTIESEIYDLDRVIHGRLSHKLTIRDVKTTDAGDYHCEGHYETEAGGEVRGERTTIRLQVEERPTITTLPQSQNATEDDDVTFLCVARGTPEPVIHWYINEMELRDSEALLRWELKEGGTQLVIYRVTLQDHFTVHCNASNRHGYHLVGAYLSVLPKPPAPETTATPTTTTTEPTTVVTTTTTTTVPTTESRDRGETEVTSQSDSAAISTQTLPIIYVNTTTQKPARENPYVGVAENGSYDQLNSREETQKEVLESQMDLKSAAFIYATLGILCLLPIVMILLLVMFRKRERSYHVGDAEARSGRSSPVDSIEDEERKRLSQDISEPECQETSV